MLPLSTKKKPPVRNAAGAAAPGSGSALLNMAQGAGDNKGYGAPQGAAIPQAGSLAAPNSAPPPAGAQPGGTDGRGSGQPATAAMPQPFAAPRFGAPEMGGVFSADVKNNAGKGGRGMDKLYNAAAPTKPGEQPMTQQSRAEAAQGIAETKEEKAQEEYDNSVLGQMNKQYEELLGDADKSWQEQQAGLQAQMAGFNRQAQAMNARMGGSIAGGYGNLAAQGLVQGMQTYNQAAQQYQQQRRQLQQAWLDKQLQEQQRQEGRGWAVEDQDRQFANEAAMEIFRETGKFPTSGFVGGNSATGGNGSSVLEQAANADRIIELEAALAKKKKYEKIVAAGWGPHNPEYAKAIAWLKGEDSAGVAREDRAWEAELAKLKG